MENGDVYKKAIDDLFQRTQAKFEHYEHKVIGLFDALLDEGVESHRDTVKKLCKEAGYDESASEEIAQIYDILSLYKKYKKDGRGRCDVRQFINH